MKRPVILLDRDGTINIDHGYVSQSEQWRLIDGVAEAIGQFTDNGFAVAVVTNQSGIGLGKYRLGDVQRLHEHMCRQLTQLGACLDAIALCPHAPSANCGCRKPQTGMLRDIERQLGAVIDRPASWMVGDKPSDLQFGKNAEVHTALIRSPYWNETELPVTPDLVVASLAEAAQLILA